MKFSKIFTILASSVALSAGVVYIFLLYGAPAILNSSFMVNKYENLISEKTGFPVKIKDFDFKTNPNLSFQLNVGSILSQKDSKIDILNIQDIEYSTKILSIKPNYVGINYVYADFSEIKSFIENKDKKTEKSSFNLDYFPMLNIKSVFVKLDNNSNIDIQNLKSKKIEDIGIVCTFLATVKTPYTKSPIIVGREGYIYYSNNMFVDDLSIDIEHSKLSLSGEFSNLNILGKALPIDELERAFLFFYKLKHPNQKNFIENFHNMKGDLDVNLNYSKDGLKGKCVANKLSANFWDYKIPINLPKVVFNFEGRKVWAKTSGTFGTEPVFTDFELVGLATPDVRVRGDVKAKLTNKFAKKYYNKIRISGQVDAKVKYFVHNKKVNIYYYLDIPQNMNLMSDYGNLENLSKHRQITAHTLKQGDKISLENYNYKFINSDNSTKRLFYGTGKFEKKNNHFKPVEITFKTSGDVPISIIKSFIRNYLVSGTFNADLNLNFNKKTLLGSLNLKDTRHSDFFILKNTDVSILNNAIKLNSAGTFFNYPIKLSLDADNNFTNGLTIHKFNVYLEKFYVRRGNINSVKEDIKNKTSQIPTKTTSSHSDYNIEVQDGKIVVGQIIHPKFCLNNVAIYGKLSHDIFDFIIPETGYSKGLLSAVGKYNIKEHSSDINFLASDIDSNEVATRIFNLPNQFEGNGYAKLHLKTKNKLNNIHAHATFAITDGFLPKLGSQEFIFNRPNKLKKVLFWVNEPVKFTLSKISNIDFKKPNVFYSNLRGTFIINNSDVDHIKIFSQSDYLSMYIEGKYNIDSQVGDLCIWGKHNKVAEKKIKIFRIPLSMLYRLVFRSEHTKETYQDKIKMIPSIKATPSELSIFKVNVDGDLNSSNLNVKLKNIK